MSTTCQVCTRPTHTYLCVGHSDELVAALRQLGGSDSRQGLYEDLLDTCWRLDHTSPSQAATRRTGGGTPEPPLPHARAVALRDHAANVIGTWARDVVETHPHLTLPHTVPAACTWLATLGALLAQHPAAGEIHHDIAGLPARIMRMIDRRPEQTYLGTCSALIGGEGCPHDVYAERDTDLDLTQCPRCGTWHDIAKRRDVLLRAADDQLLTATELRVVLSRYMPDVPPAGTIRRWASTGRLARRTPHANRPREPRYRLGDILDLMATMARDPARRCVDQRRTVV